jgi:hypothetical protein
MISTSFGCLRSWNRFSDRHCRSERLRIEAMCDLVTGPEMGTREFFLTVLWNRDRLIPFDSRHGQETRLV